MHRPALPLTAAAIAGFWPGLALAQTTEPALATGLPPDQALATAGIIVAVAGALLLAALAVILWLRRRLHDARRHADVLAQSQRRMAQALDGPKSGVLLWAPGAKAVTLPPQIAKLLGLPAGETLALDRLTFAVSTPDRAMLGTGAGPAGPGRRRLRHGLPAGRWRAHRGLPRRPPAGRRRRRPDEPADHHRGVPGRRRRHRDRQRERPAAGGPGRHAHAGLAAPQRSDPRILQQGLCRRRRGHAPAGGGEGH